MNTDAITIEYDSGTLTAEDFLDDGFILEESLCSASQIAFGACEAAAVEVKIASTAASFVGKTLTVKLGTNALGKYKVVSDERASDGETRVLKAYDALYDINGRDVTDWYKSIDWSSVTTLKQFRDSFFNYVGITQASVNLVNDGMTVTETLDVTSCSGATILKAICELNGVFGHINANGHFQYYSLSAGVATSINEDEVLELTLEDFTVPAFDSVLIRTEEGDIGGQYPSSGSVNQYIITGNFLCYGKTGSELQTIAQNALSKIGDRPYIPFSATLECQGNIALGGRVNIATEDATVTTNVLRRSLVGFEALEEYLAAQGSPEYVPDVNSSRNQMIATEQRVNRLSTTLDGTINEVKVIKGDYVTSGTLQLTENAFNARFEDVDKELQQITEELDGNISFYNVDVDLSDKAAHPIERTYPSYNWTYNVVCGKSVCSNQTKFEYTVEGLRKNLRSLAFNEKTSESYRFIKEGTEFLWQTVSDTDFGVAMARIASLEVGTEQIKTEVKEQSVLITKQGAALTTVETSITQTNNAISEEVKRAKGAEEEIVGTLELKIDVDDNDQVVSMLNASADRITLNGNRIVINSDKFKVAADGTVTASNANISGAITSDNANITGGHLTVGNKFAVDADGTLTASGANISGTITSNNANITGGNLKVGDNFSVDASGNLVAKSAVITGYATTGYADSVGTNAVTVVEGKGYQTENGVKTIINGVVDVDYLNAKGITAKDFTATSISGKTITGSTISGGTITGATIVSNNATITGGKINISSSNSGYADIVLKTSDRSTDYFFTEIGSGEIRHGYVNTAGNELYTSIDVYGRIRTNQRPYVDGTSVMCFGDTDWKQINLTLTSGSKTFSASGYNTLVLKGRTGASAPNQMLTIPLSNLSSGTQIYAITQGSAVLTATLSINSSGTVTITYGGSNLSSGAMWVYAYLQK